MLVIDRRGGLRRRVFRIEGRGAEDVWIPPIGSRHARKAALCIRTFHARPSEICSALSRDVKFLEPGPSNVSYIQHSRLSEGGIRASGSGANGKAEWIPQTIRPHARSCR